MDVHLEDYLNIASKQKVKCSQTKYIWKEHLGKRGHDFYWRYGSYAWA